jgi:hypothetical protein
LPLAGTAALTAPAAAAGDGLPPITGNLVVLGSGGTTISRSATAGFRIVDVAPGGSLTLANVTVTNGSGAGVGGGIQNAGQLSVDHSRLAGNTAAAFGGGLSTEAGGTSRITRTTVARNRAGNLGGGIANLGTTVLTGSRVVFNHAADGGGISNAPNGIVSLRFTLVAFNSPDNCTPQGTIRGCRN